MKIAQRHTLFSKREEIRLTKNGIARIRGERTVKEIQFKDIKSVQLLCEGYSTAHEKVVYRCIVRAPGKSLTFSNALFRDPQTKMDTQYRKIVQKLHDKVHSNTSETKFVQGSNTYYALGWLIWILGSLSLAVLTLMPIWAVFAGKGFSPSARIPWGIALLPFGVIGVALPLIQLGKKSKYDPLLIPYDYLP